MSFNITENYEGLMDSENDAMLETILQCDENEVVRNYFAPLKVNLNLAGKKKEEIILSLN
tara:strand:+ start:578 stop:757 length:180 start_codon:yes stop_codon:yes gene_type:complete